MTISSIYVKPCKGYSQSFGPCLLELSIKLHKFLLMLCAGSCKMLISVSVKNVAQGESGIVCMRPISTKICTTFKQVGEFCLDHRKITKKLLVLEYQNFYFKVKDF